MRPVLLLLALLLAALLSFLVGSEEAPGGAPALSHPSGPAAARAASSAALEGVAGVLERPLAPGEERAASTRQEASDDAARDGFLWLRGRAVDEDGRPLVGAKVTLGHDARYRRTRSGPDGAFELMGPPPSAGVSAGAQLRIAADDGFWDEGRYLADQVELGAELGDVVVPGRSRVEWSIAGDATLGGFGNGFRFTKAPREGEPRLRPAPGGWTWGATNRIDETAGRASRTTSLDDAPSLDLVPWRPLVEGGRGLAYGLEPGRYELRFEVHLDRSRYTEPLATFDLAEGERVDLGRVSLDAAFDWRRITLLEDGDPLGPGVEVLVGPVPHPLTESNLDGLRRVHLDPGGALRVPLPHGRDGASPLQTLLVRLADDGRDPTVDILWGQIYDPRSASSVTLERQPFPFTELRSDDTSRSSERRDTER